MLTFILNTFAFIHLYIFRSLGLRNFKVNEGLGAYYPPMTYTHVHFFILKNLGISKKIQILVFLV